MSDEIKKKLREASDSMEWGMADEAVDLLKQLQEKRGDDPEINRKLKEAKAMVAADADDEDDDEAEAGFGKKKVVQSVPMAPPSQSEADDFEKPETSPGFHFSAPTSPPLHEEPLGAESKAPLARRIAAVKQASQKPQPAPTTVPTPSVSIGGQEVPLAGTGPSAMPTAPFKPAEKPAGSTETTELSLSDVEVVESKPEAPAPPPPTPTPASKDKPAEDEPVKERPPLVGIFLDAKPTRRKTGRLKAEAQPEARPEPAPPKPPTPHPAEEKVAEEKAAEEKACNDAEYAEAVTEELSLSDVEMEEVEPPEEASGRIHVRPKPMRKLTPKAVLVDMEALGAAVEAKEKEKEENKEHPKAAAEPAKAPPPGPAARIEPYAAPEPASAAAVAAPPAEKGKGRLVASIIFGAGLLAIIVAVIFVIKNRGKRKTKETTAVAAKDNKAEPGDARSPDPPDMKAATADTRPTTPDMVPPMSPPDVNPRETREPPPPAARNARDARPAPPRKVRLTLNITPVEARPFVRFRGKRYRGKEFTSPPSDPEAKSEKVTIAAKGYKTVVLTLTIKADLTRDVELVPLRKPRAPRVAAAPRTRHRARTRARARARAGRRSRAGRRRGRKPMSRLIGLE